MKFLIAYDITCPKRLRRVARALERRALRTQKSVFVFEGTEGELRQCIESLTGLLDLATDCLQAWRLAAGQSLVGEVRGNATLTLPPAIVLDGSSELSGPSMS